MQHSRYEHSNIPSVLDQSHVAVLAHAGGEDDVVVKMSSKGLSDPTLDTQARGRASGNTQAIGRVTRPSSTPVHPECAFICSATSTTTDFDFTLDRA